MEGTGGFALQDLSRGFLGDLIQSQFHHSAFPSSVLQQFLNDQTVIERYDVVPKYLIVFMALARYQDVIVLLAHLQGLKDRFFPVRFDLIFFRSGLFDPGFNSAMIAKGSSLRGLSEVKMLQSASSPAAFPIRGRFDLSRSPPAPKHQDDPCLAQFFSGFQELAQGVIGMGIVDKDAISPIVLDPFKSPGDAFDGSDPGFDGLERDI